MRRAGLHQDPVDDCVQQLLELLGGAVGHGPFDPASDPGQEVVRGHRGGGVALRRQCRCACLQPLDLVVQLRKAVGAGRLGQPLSLEGPQVAVDRRPSLPKGHADRGQFGLATRVLGVLGVVPVRVVDR
jgi:hypothetical protein